MNVATLLPIFPAKNPSERPAEPRADGYLRIALVCMPWGAIRTPSLALAILKRCAQEAGFTADVRMLNVRFAEILGLKVYEPFAEGNFCAPEWFFSQALFGPQGLGLIPNDWESLKANTDAIGLVRKVEAASGDSEEFRSRLANELVPRFIDECMETVDWGQYLAVGFTTVFAQSLASLLLSKRIKDAYPHVKVIFGGANVESEMGVELMRGCGWIDYVVHGEAEKSFPELLRSLANGRIHERVPGVSMRRNGGILAGDADAKPTLNMNEAPVPDYSDYIQALDRSGLRKQLNLKLWYESSRGCWWGAKHHCTFCGLNGDSMVYRKKTPQKVFAELLELSQRYRCLSFAATDNIVAPEYFTELFPKLAERDLDFDLFYEVKANLTRELVKTLRNGRVHNIQPGIESFSSRLLRLMRKGVTAIQNIQLLKWCYEYQVGALYNILYGFPGELPDDYTGLPGLFRLLSHLQPPTSLSPVIFERFSPYFFDRETFGLTLDPLREYQFLYPPSRFSLEKVAYFFSGRGPCVVEPDEYIAPSADAWKAWIDRWQKQEVFCYYEKGPGYIVIHDNRPRIESAPLAHRKTTIDEIGSDVYLFCDENHSLRCIYEMLCRKYPGAWSQAKLRDWLNQIVFQGLMFNEGDRYLSLAVRKNKPGG